MLFIRALKNTLVNVNKPDVYLIFNVFGTVLYYIRDNVQILNYYDSKCFRYKIVRIVLYTIVSINNNLSVIHIL